MARCAGTLSLVAWTPSGLDVRRVYMQSLAAHVREAVDNAPGPAHARRFVKEHQTMSPILAVMLLAIACFIVAGPVAANEATKAPTALNWNVELPKAAITLGTTLIGSFVGAVSAFWLQ